MLLDKKPPPSWPSKGSLAFDNMSLRYNEKNDPVLKNINCQINSNEKVGSYFYHIIGYKWQK